MHPVVDWLFRSVLVLAFAALVASVVIGRRLTDREAPAAHDARTCSGCAALRHPSQHEARTALAALLPRQTRRGQR